MTSSRKEIVFPSGGSRNLTRALSATSVLGLLTATGAGMLAVGAMILDPTPALLLGLAALASLVVAVSAMITTIKRWAALVEDIREKALLLTDATKDGVWLFNPRSGETFFSSHLRSQLGIDGKADMDAILRVFGQVDPADATRAWESWSLLLAERKSFALDVRLTVQGEARWYRWSGRASAEDAPMFLGALRCIHDLRKVEERVNDIAKFAVESPNPVFRLDPQGVIVLANRAAGPLLERWKTAPGRPIPNRVLQLLLPHFETNQKAELEFAFGGRQYSALFVPHLEKGYVNVFCTDVTERAQLYQTIEESRSKLHEAHERMRFMAQHDPLTRLPNRALYEDRLVMAVELAKRKNTTIALMMIDLDRFKEINDTFGHDAGDAVLQEVAQRLVGSVRGSDTVARLGGDEFAIILGDLQERANAILIAEKILVSMAEPILHQGARLETSPSIGIAFAGDGLDQVPIGELNKRADVAMYQAKMAGRNCFRVYEPAWDGVQLAD